MRIMLALAALALASCSSQKTLAVDACEGYIKAGLRSPSTYKVVETTLNDPIKADSGRFVRTISISYDAANAFGTPIRGAEICSFVVDSSGNFAKNLKVEADLASARRALGEGGGCCISPQVKTPSQDPVADASSAEAAASAAVAAAMGLPEPTTSTGRGH